jgi:hypothetical protein
MAVNLRRDDYCSTCQRPCSLVSVIPLEVADSVVIYGTCHGPKDSELSSHTPSRHGDTCGR